MADEKKPKDPEKKAAHDDDVVGKVYDGRLMRRLLTYLRPYRLQTGGSCCTIFFKGASDVMGPYLVKIAVDTYMSTPAPAHPGWLARHLNPVPATGITQLGLLYLGT